MNVLIALSIGFVLGVLACSSLGVLIYRRFVRRQVEHIEAIKEAHRSDWQTLIHLLNHTGQIPNEATGAGLTDLISRALKRCIRNLKELLEAQDWRTHPVIEELEGVALADMEMLNQKLEDILESHRNHLKEFDWKQE